MGKAKQRDRVKHRANPLEKEIKPPSDPELAALREKRILPVIKDLQSPDQNKRSAAARAITNLIEDEKTRKLLLREQLVKILLEQTLTDSTIDTRCDGWGILRNLVLEEEADFCIHLYRRDILTAIDGAITSIVETIHSPELYAKLPKAHQDLIWNFTSSIITLITSLFESQDEIAQAISNVPSIGSFLFGLLVTSVTPYQTATEVLTCLTSLLEDNEPLAKTLSGMDKQEKLNVIMCPATDTIGINEIMACGVFHNLYTSMGWLLFEEDLRLRTDSDLLKILNQAIHERVDRTQSQTKAVVMKPKSSGPDQLLQRALELTASIASTLQEAFERKSDLNNEKEFKGFDDTEVTNGDDDEMKADGEDDIDEMEHDGENADEGMNGEDDEMDFEAIEADMERVTNENAEDISGDSDYEESALTYLVTHMAPWILPFASTQNPNRIHAISALNNIAWTLSSIEPSSRPQRITEIWVSLSQSIWDQAVSCVLASDTADFELASIVTSLAWALSRSVEGSINIKAGEQQKFMSLYHASKHEPSVEANGNGQAVKSTQDAFQRLDVKCIGVLGSLALQPAEVTLNKEIGQFLLNVIAALPETKPAAAIEALDQIFEIYADKEYAYDEPIFWGGDFMNHLQDLQPKIKKMAKSIDKRFFPQLRERADEVLLNFDRFLGYKRREKKSSGKNGSG